jgi:hypothetical protein
MRTLINSGSPADLSRTVIITPYSNSARYATRPELYKSFAKMIESTGVRMITAEIAFGDREFEVTDQDNINHVQFRSIEELWHKENICNKAAEYALQLWPDTREIMIIDGDCWPVAIPPLTWLEETWHQLQHYQIVQMWKYLINFGPDGQPISNPQLSFMATYASAGFSVPPKGQAVKHTLAGNSGEITLGRPGLAWAYNVDAWNKIGGLLDICILGSGDWHMAHALVGATDRSSYEASKVSDYLECLLHFQDLCERWIKRDVGFVDVTLGHGFHGNKVDRRYGDRGQILIKNKYSPRKDIKRDVYGVWQLETWDPRQVVLRDQIREYFKTRNEDSVPLR